MVLLGVLLAGCSAPGDSGGGLAGAPAIALDTGDVDFGALTAGERAEDRIAIESVGGDLLVVEGVELEDATHSFALQNPPDILELEPGASHGVMIAFSPKAEGWIEAVFTVRSNDPEVPEISARVGGEGLYGHLSIRPDPLELAPIEVGCRAAASLTLSNVGGDDLEITGIVAEGDPAPELGWDFSLPLLLAPGASRELDVGFSPSAEGALRAELTVSSDELAGQRSSLITGEASLPPPVTDSFSLPDPPLDLAVVVDQSEGMGEAQARLVAAFPALVDRAEALGLDWQLSVWNGEGGCTNSGALSAGVEDLEGRFSEAVTGFFGTGQYLRFDPSMLTVAALGAEQLAGGQCNEGLRREGAVFQALLVSDGPDQGADSWADYVDRIAAGAGGEVLISAIAGPPPEGCAIAGPGDGYYEAVEATGGLFLDLCAEDWSDHLVALAERGAGYTDTFPLSREPLSPELIAVSVNGEPLSEGWSYLPESRAVRVEGALPGDALELRYTPAPECR